jgi:putative transposase
LSYVAGKLGIVGSISTKSADGGAVAPDENTRLIRAYRYALDPTPTQAEQLRARCGAQRFAFNWGLRAIKANLEQRAAERSYGIADDDLTPPLSWSLYALRREWNRVKDDVAPWWPENSKEAYSSGLANLAASLDNWGRSLTGHRRGPRMQFPRFKSKRNRMVCRFTTGAFGLSAADRRHVKVPRIGLLRTHESTRKLARRVAAGSARIRSATVSYTRGRWFISFSVEIDTGPASDTRPGSIVGVDVGVRNLAVMSSPIPRLTDEEGAVPNPAYFEGTRKALRRMQRKTARRRGPDRRTGTTPSTRWCRAQSRVDRLHARLANRRSDALHQLTTMLVRGFGVVVIEDLNIAGMLRNRRLARRIADASWGELRRQLQYKSQWYGSRLIVADRFYASSKTCSRCGAVRAKLLLSERNYQCEACGMSIDRDVNAARNLAAFGYNAVDGGASSSSCGATVNEPAGNPFKSSQAGSGYRHGKPLEGNVA